MLQTVLRLLPELPLFLMTALATHLIMSFAQTLMHYKLGHRPMGGKFFRNHINFHHTYYSKDHLVSRTYLGNEGDNTPFFFIPVLLVGACTYLLLPFDLFVVQVVACAASFYAHVFFDREYHVVLLRYKLLRARCTAALPQHGQRGKRVTIAAMSLRRMVAIEFGMCRSGRKGGSSGSVTVGYGKLREQRGGTRS